MEQPKIPTLKDTQSPQVKLRGLGAGLTLFDRLKQFKKKDLAFIMAGLGTLFMAPLAEHFMMSPESGDGTLSQGWSGRGGGGSNIFGSGGSPYEPGTTGMAPGAAIGGGGDIITPLNVRDPSALVMGPGQTQQPPTNSVMPPTPPPTAPITRSDSDLKDALAASARGVGGAAKKAALPVPKTPLTGSQLRGLGVAGGGSSAAANLGKIDASNVPNRGSTGGGLSRVTSAPGFKGVATRGPGTGGGGMDALKKAADSAGNVFNRGSAGSGLAEAAATQMGGGGNPFFGQGQGGAGPNDKGFGGNQDKNAKNLGESLAFLQKKERMQKDLELEYKKKEANDWGLQSALMRNEMLKTMSQGLAKGITDIAMGAFKQATSFEPPNSKIVCRVGAGEETFQPSQGYSVDRGMLMRDGKEVDRTKYHNCSRVVNPPAGSTDNTGSSVTAPPKGAAAPQNTGDPNLRPANPQQPATPTVTGGVCDDVDKTLGPGHSFQSTEVGLFGTYRTAAHNLVTVREAFNKRNPTECGGRNDLLGPNDKTVMESMAIVKTKLSAAITAINAQLDKQEKVRDLPGEAEFNEAVAAWKDAERIYTAADTRLTGVTPSSLGPGTAPGCDANCSGKLSGYRGTLGQDQGGLQTTSANLKRDLGTALTALREVGLALGKSVEADGTIKGGTESTVKINGDNGDLLKQVQDKAKAMNIQPAPQQVPAVGAAHDSVETGLSGADQHIQKAKTEVEKVQTPYTTQPDPATLKPDHPAYELGKAEAAHKTVVDAHKKWMTDVKGRLP